MKTTTQPFRFLTVRRIAELTGRPVSQIERLIDEHPTDGHRRLSARVRPGGIPAAAIDHRSV